MVRKASIVSVALAASLAMTSAAKAVPPTLSSISHQDRHPVLTDSEIQSGRWSDESQIDPGTYWVMLRASPDFDACYISGSGTFDPACADGFSNVLTLSVPKPAIRYVARVTAYRYIGQASLRLTATPLGERLPYRVCYRLKRGGGRCLNGVSLSSHRAMRRCASSPPSTASCSRRSRAAGPPKPRPRSANTSRTPPPG